MSFPQFFPTKSSEPFSLDTSASLPNLSYTQEKLSEILQPCGISKEQLGDLIRKAEDTTITREEKDTLFSAINHLSLDLNKRIALHEESLKPNTILKKIFGAKRGVFNCSTMNPSGTLKQIEQNLKSLKKELDQQDNSSASVATSSLSASVTTGQSESPIPTDEPEDDLTDGFQLLSICFVTNPSEQILKNFAEEYGCLIVYKVSEKAPRIFYSQDGQRWQIQAFPAASYGISFPEAGQIKKLEVDAQYASFYRYIRSLGGHTQVVREETQFYFEPSLSLRPV